MTLISELRRRNVFRMAVLYVVAAWLIMQVAEVVKDLANLPDWIGPTILILLAVGFPIAIALSWFYEITLEGISLEKDVAPGESIAHVTSRRLDLVVIALMAAALIMFAYDKWSVPELPAQSIAVLAFENMSSDPEQEYFSDGLSDTLIHVLAQVSGLKVTAKTSSFYFKGKNIDITDIARALNVGTILEGSVQKAGNQVRVTAQLINADDGTHLWSKSFDRDLKDLFAVQDDIAQEVVRELKVTLLETEQERLAQRYQLVLEAYEQLIRGRHEMDKRTADNLAVAEQHFKWAIELDPDYALAYVGLANTYGLQNIYGSLLFEEAMRRIPPLLDKALELNPLSGEVHYLRARLQVAAQWKAPEEDFHGIEEDILKAIELSPNYAEAHRWHSVLLRGQGRFEEALVRIRLAAELDPMSPVIQLNVARAVWDTGRAEEALTLIRRNIERNPEFPDNYSVMAGFQTQLGHLGQAQRWNHEARKRNPDDHNWSAECLGFCDLGDVVSAENCAKQAREAHPEKIVTGVTWATMSECRGDLDEAIKKVERLSERLPGWRGYDRWLADMVAGQGDVERARRLMAEVFPELLEDGLEPAAIDLDSALVFAAILHSNGETERRDVLLQALEERIATMHRTRGIGYGVLDVYVHAMRGDRDKAIAALRDAIDIGWRGGNFGGWMLRQNWKLAGLHQDPEFIALMDELEADIRKQREWYEEHKDDPLF